jgi:hypothetical protein
MIEEKTIEGSYLEIRLAPKAMPLRTAEANAAFPRQPPGLETQLITLRFEVEGKAVTEVRPRAVCDQCAAPPSSRAGTINRVIDAGRRGPGSTLTVFSMLTRPRARQRRCPRL